MHKIYKALLSWKNKNKHRVWKYHSFLKFSSSPIIETADYPTNSELITGKDSPKDVKSIFEVHSVLKTVVESDELNEDSNDSLDSSDVALPDEENMEASVTSMDENAKAVDSSKEIEEEGAVEGDTESLDASGENVNKPLGTSYKATVPLVKSEKVIDLSKESSRASIVVSSEPSEVMPSKFSIFLSWFKHPIPVGTPVQKDVATPADRYVDIKTEASVVCVPEGNKEECSDETVRDESVNRATVSLDKMGELIKDNFDITDGSTESIGTSKEFTNETEEGLYYTQSNAYTASLLMAVKSDVVVEANKSAQDVSVEENELLLELSDGFNNSVEVINEYSEMNVSNVNCNESESALEDYLSEKADRSENDEQQAIKFENYRQIVFVSESEYESEGKFSEFKSLSF